MRRVISVPSVAPSLSGFPRFLCRRGFSYLVAREVAASVVRGMLRDALGLPIKHPCYFEAERIFKDPED